MSRRGTLDARTVDTWRREPVRLPRRFEDVDIPTPRAADHRAPLDA